MAVYASLLNGGDGHSEGSRSNKITDQEYDQIYNKLVLESGYTPEEAKAYIAKNYW